MDKKSINKIIIYLNERLSEKGIDVAQIILFGSQAKRTADKDSDIDLIVVSENFRKKDIFKRADMIDDAVASTIKQFHVAIDVLLETPEEVDNEYMKQIGAVVFAA